MYNCFQIQSIQVSYTQEHIFYTQKGIQWTSNSLQVASPFSLTEDARPVFSKNLPKKDA